MLKKLVRMSIESYNVFGCCREDQCVDVATMLEDTPLSPTVSVMLSVPEILIKSAVHQTLIQYIRV